MKTLWDDLQAHLKGAGFALFYIVHTKKNAIIFKFRLGPSSFWVLTPDEVSVTPGMTQDTLDAALLANAKAAFAQWEIEQGKAAS